MTKYNIKIFLLLALSVLIVLPAACSSPKEETADKKSHQFLAPLFFHREKNNSYYNYFSGPFAFLSEIKTIEMIKSRLEKENIIFDKKGYIVDNIYSLDVRELMRKNRDKSYKIPKSLRHPFYFDLYSTRYNFGIKFISWRAYCNLAEIRSELQDIEEASQKPQTRPENIEHQLMLGGLLSFTDMIYTALRARECIKNYTNISAAFFYDPLVISKNQKRYYYTDIMDCDLLEQREDNKKLIELQVNDFIKWFKNTFKLHEKNKCR